MNVHKLSKILKSLVTDEHATQWAQTKDPAGYCRELVGTNHEHPVISTILVDVLNNLLAYRAKAIFAETQAINRNN